jgi:hypothetical protein
MTTTGRVASSQNENLAPLLKSDDKSSINFLTPYTGVSIKIQIDF